MVHPPCLPELRGYSIGCGVARELQRISAETEACELQSRRGDAKSIRSGSRAGLVRRENISAKNRQALLVGEIKERFWAFIGGVYKEKPYRLRRMTILGLLARRYSGVPLGRRPDVVSDPAINRRATVICPCGTRSLIWN